MDEVEAWTQGMVGQTLEGRYRLDAVIGIGAMGSVFRGHHLGLGRDMAVKLLHPQLTANPEMRARFSREAAAASKLDHANCVRVTDFGVTEDGLHFLVMDLLQGHELTTRLGDRFSPPEALALVDQVLAGLEHAHARGLIHRDVKPENIFLTTDDQGRQVAKLVDFGIVKLQEGAAGGQLTQFGIVVGTPQYMSPEQAVGQRVDPRADLYAVGVILYILLSGHPPFENDDPVAVLRAQIREPPPPLPNDVPDPVRTFVMRLLAKDPDERYPTATEARRVLASLGPPPVAAASAVPRMAPTTAPKRQLDKRQMGLLAVGATLALALVITIATRKGDGDSETSETKAAATAKSGSTNDESGALSGADARGEGDADGDPDASDDGPSRALEANLASIDALIQAGKYDAAQIALDPLLASYEDEAQLHWRMGRVLTKLRGPDNRSVALQHYAAAVIAEPELLDDASFEIELWGLLDDPKLREQAVDVAIDRLDARAHDKLLQWLNTQASPLPHLLRHRIIGHLVKGGRGTEINRPLQLALDLWQASSAEDPCKAFADALAAAVDDPDSFLLGTLQTVRVPSAGETACPGGEEALEGARAKHESMFAGLEPTVPKAFRKRPTPPPSSNRKSGRRR